MSDTEAFELMQEMLNKAEQLKESGHYSIQEIHDEITSRLGED